VLTSKQRQQLKALAHHLEPVVQVGKAGVSNNLIEAVRQALLVHELIKVKFVEYKDERELLSSEISAQLDSELVAIQGNVAILYKAHPDPERRTIELDPA
jgi:RNA-binding protein